MIARALKQMSVMVVATSATMNIACTGGYHEIRTHEMREIRDEEGNIIGVESRDSTEGGAEIDIDDRVLDIVPVPRRSKVDDQQGPADLPEPRPSGRTPQGTVLDRSTPLNYFMIDELVVHFELGKVAIDTEDWLEFHVLWNVEVRERARKIILDTFDGATFPTPRKIVYAGPADEGIELAALLGLRRMTLPVRLGEFTVLEPIATWPALLDALTLSIDPDTDKVTLNGVHVLELGPAAHALDD